MSVGWISGGALPALERSMAFAEARHQVLASNLANIDTPGYQTADLPLAPFQNALKQLVESQRSGLPLSPHESAKLDSQQAQLAVRDTMQQILYHDGSDVSLEQQVTEISKNQSMHNLTVALMRAQHRMLSVAISESVNV
jgi:flagellar basal-body rod protein FlgB